MYKTSIDTRPTFIINKILNKSRISENTMNEGISKNLTDNDHIPIEHFINCTKELSQGSAVIHLKELLKMYLTFIIDLIKNDIAQFENKIGQELKEKDDKARTVDSLKDLVWKHETIKEKTITIVKCIQNGSDDGIFKVNLIFTTINTDVTTWRCVFIKDKCGKQILSVRDIQLLVMP